MKLQDGVARLGEFAAAHGGVPLEIAGDSRVRIRVGIRGEISLVLELGLSSNRARGPAFLVSRLTFHGERLSTTPVDDAFLQSLEGVPEKQASDLTAFRRAMNGHVPFLLLAERPAGDPFADAGPLSAWTAPVLAEHLSRILTAAMDVGSRFEWPGKAEDFLVWAQARMAGSAGLMRLQAWSVTPEV